MVSIESIYTIFIYIQRTGLVKLRRVLRAIRKHFPQPPDYMLDGNPIEKFLDDPDLCENKLLEEAGSDGFQNVIMKFIYQGNAVLKQQPTTIERYMVLYFYTNSQLYINNFLYHAILNLVL